MKIRLMGSPDLVREWAEDAAQRLQQGKGTAALEPPEK